jgi:hypothetical protein
MVNQVNANCKSRSSFVLVGVFIALTFLLTGNSQKTHAQEFSGAIVDVVPDAAALSAVPQNGDFYVKGSIYTAGSVKSDGALSGTAEQVGVWYCWGHSDNGLLVANCSYSLDAFNGSIQIQGSTGDAKQAIIGGAGKFKGALGEVEIKPLGASGAFRAYFNFVNKPARINF